MNRIEAPNAMGMAQHLLWGLVWVLWVLLAFPIAAQTPNQTLAGAARADAVVGSGTTTSCTDEAFDIALDTVQSSGGGTITFNCGGAHTILFNSARTISSQVVIDGGGMITLSGNNFTRIFNVVSGARLELHNITLSKGYSSANGGAISSLGGTLYLVNATFSDNRTSNEGGSGGAILSEGPITAVNSRFENNSAANGGAIYLRYGVGSFISTTFKGNKTLSSTNGWGGAILLWDGARLTVRGCNFENNSSRLGGAIHNAFNNVKVVIERSSLIANEAIQGGGIYLKLGTLIITESTLSFNKAAWYGGGLDAEGGVISISGSTLAGNRASEGGGIAIATSSAAELSILNSTLNGNTATSIDIGGGAISVIALNGSVKVDLRHATIAYNIGIAGGLAFDTLGPTVDVSLVNTVLAGNQSPTCYLWPSIESAAIARFSLWSDTSCIFGTSHQNHPNTPAELGPLANNGGLTLTRAPLAGSPLIDNGTCLVGVATDQRGAHRLHGPACDIGSVEASAAFPDSIFSDRFQGTPEGS